eukprot:766321-Hanusia_phi.AAC.2
MWLFGGPKGNEHGTSTDPLACISSAVLRACTPGVGRDVTEVALLEMEPYMSDQRYIAECLKHMKCRIKDFEPLVQGRSAQEGNVTETWRPACHHAAFSALCPTGFHLSNPLTCCSSHSHLTSPSDSFTGAQVCSTKVQVPEDGSDYHLCHAIFTVLSCRFAICPER